MLPRCNTGGRALGNQRRRPCRLPSLPQLLDDDMRLGAAALLARVERVGVDGGGDTEVLTLGVDADDRAAAADVDSVGHEQDEVDFASGVEGVVGLEIDAHPADVARRSL